MRRFLGATGTAGMLLIALLPAMSAPAQTLQARRVPTTYSSAAPRPARATPSTSLRTVHVGGVITAIDAAGHTVTMLSTALKHAYIVEITARTIMALSRWPAAFGDLARGDHIAVSGTPDPATYGHNSTRILAQHIHIASPRFAGYITAIQRTTTGDTILSVQPGSGHDVRIDVPEEARVIFGKQSIQARELVAGLQVAAQGLRTGKFELRATALRVHVHSLTIGGTVTGLARGTILLADGYNKRRYAIRNLPGAAYVWSGKPIPATMVQSGIHLRVHGYNALHNTRPGITDFIADRITVLVAQRTVGGTVVGAVSRGDYELVNSYNGVRVIVRLTPQTRYMRTGRVATAALVRIGAHLRVHGYDAPRNDRRGILTIIALSVDIATQPVHLRHYVTSGTVTAVTGNGLRAMASDGSRIVLGLTRATTYDVRGQTVAATALQAGMPIRAHVHSDTSNALLGPSPVIADRVDLLVQQHALGGVVTHVSPTSLQISNDSGGKTNITLTPHTAYQLLGKAARARVLHSGLHVQVHGYSYSQSGTTVLVADQVGVVLYYHTVSGHISGLARTGMLLTNTQAGTQLIVQTTGQTAYVLGKKPVKKPALQIGFIVRAYGYDAIQAVTPTLIATRITITIPVSHTGGQKAPTPVITATATPTPSATTIIRFIPVITSVPTQPPSATPAPRATTAMPSATAPPTMTPFATPTTLAFVPIITIMPTPLPVTASPTVTPRPTLPSSPTPSLTTTTGPASTPSLTPTPTVTSSPTLVPSPSAPPSSTAAPPATPTLTATPSPTPTLTATPSITPALTATESAASTSSPTTSATSTPALTITASATSTPALTIIASATPAPTTTGTVLSTALPTEIPTLSPTPPPTGTR